MLDSEMTSPVRGAAKRPVVGERPIAGERPVIGQRTPRSPRLRIDPSRPERARERAQEREVAPHKVVVVQGMRITLPGLHFMERTLPPPRPR
ncbi:hypothetical protein [Salinarimonas ramus]|nr:hypothetical protein [Salinarimonas ramus]